MRSRAPALCIDVALVGAAGAVTFLPGIFGEFLTWDDDRNFLHNPHYRGLGWRQVAWAFTTFHMGHYKPLTWLTLGLDHVLWGMDPRGYHLTSLALHAGTAALFLLVARHLVRRASPGLPEPAVRVAAVAAALLFAIHPLRVESVVWITERRDVLSGLFYMATVLAYLRYVVASPAGGHWYGATVGLFAAALLSKSIVLGLPIVLLILDVYPLRRLGGPAGWTGPAARRVLLEKVPLLGLSAAAGIAGVMAVRTVHAMPSLAEFGIGQRVAVSLYGMAFYLWKSVVPLGLSPLYHVPPDLDPFAGRFVLAGATSVGLSVAVVALRRRWPALLVAGGAYLVTLLPVLGPLQNGPQMVADRYSYLSCLGWALIAGTGAGRCASVWMVGARHRGKAAAGLVAMALAAVLLVALSARQCLVWQDSVTLWSHALALDPDNARAAVALGATWLVQGENSEARRLFERSVRLDPLLAEGLMGLAVSWSLDGEGRQALVFAERSVARRPLDAGLRYFHGVVLRAAGLQEAALAAFAEAARLSPVEPGPRYATATLLAELGRHDEAARALAEARRIARALDPDDPEADRFEALVYTQSDPARAEQAWRRYLDRLLLASDVTPLVLGRRRAAAAALQALGTAPGSAPAVR